MMRGIGSGSAERPPVLTTNVLEQRALEMLHRELNASDPGLRIDAATGILEHVRHQRETERFERMEKLRQQERKEDQRHRNGGRP